MANSALIPRLKTPGVYIEEISLFPPSVAQVPTAIPVFIGYTERAENARGEDLTYKPTRISSVLEYVNFFGGPDKETGISVEIIEKIKDPVSGAEKAITPKVSKATIDPNKRSKFLMYYSIQFFYANGGGDCWIVSVNPKPDESGYKSLITFNDDSDATRPVGLIPGLDTTDEVDEITLFVFPDAQGFAEASDFYNLYKAALDKCVELGDRFAIIDIWKDPNGESVDVFRSTLPTADINILKYGAAYYPNLNTILDYAYDDEAVTLTGADVLGGKTKLSEIIESHTAIYAQAKAAIRAIPLELPPSPGMAGIYAAVDNARGVWKSPANVGMDYVVAPVVSLTDKKQENLNIHVTSGKSVNAIRSFTGKGPAIVWGARTLAGNDNEWRYISVRRFFNMVEESVKKATVQFVFEPNDKNTWVRIKSMIDNFLTLQWQAGALQGSTAEQAFYVKAGLGETMTALDILEGRLIVEIGMAVVRPAEFIILQFMHKLPEA